MTSEGPIILFDGTCALCHGAVTFVLERDRTRAARFAPLEGETAARLLSGRREFAGVDALIWLEPSGRALTHSAAVIEIGRYLGGGWAFLAALLHLIPRPLRDALYDRVARGRHRVFGRYAACPAPPPEHRGRFLP